MNPVIVIKKLSKRYSPSAPLALQDLSININKGEVFGFLGPNGAGKSTTIRLLLNIIQPTGGQASISGLDIVQDSVQIRRNIGYLTGDFSAYPKMTGVQLFSYLNEIQKPKNKRYFYELARRFNLDVHKRIGSLSKGNKQKVGIIQAFMHQPDIFILDEPTDGLDPLMQDEFYKLIRETKKLGSTFFISSHNLNEVRKICDRVAIIREGKLVSEKRISELTLESSQTFDITFDGKSPSPELRKLKGIKILHSGGNSISLQTRGNLGPLFKILSKYTISQLSTKELNLEEEFMKYYEKDKK